jgi:hypothetical protein
VFGVSMRSRAQAGERERSGGRGGGAYRHIQSLGMVLLLAAPSMVVQFTVPLEYRNKASFLATFPSFIDLPGDAFPTAAAPFVVCVMGDFRFRTYLAEITRTTTPHGRRTEVRCVHKHPELRSCRILFVSQSEAKRYAKVLQAVL